MKYDYSIVIAIDFDGTLTKKDNFPLSNEFKIDENAIKWARRFQNEGAEVILWTCRSGDSLEKAIKELKKYNFVPNFINQGNGKRFEKSPKINADIYIDDRSSTNSEINWKDYYLKFKAIKEKNLKLKQLGF